MNETNAFSVIRAGLDGVAVVSAICSKPDVCAAAEKNHAGDPARPGTVAIPKIQASDSGGKGFR